MVRIFAVLVVLAAVACRPAGAQTLAVYSDSLATSTCIETSLVPYLDLFVVFVPGGSVGEIQGAQFRLEGIPEDWVIQSSTPNTMASFFLGDPFDANWPEGSVAFPACRQGVVMLWKATVFAWPTVENHAIEVKGQAFCPGGHSCWGPMVNLCDAPVYTSVVLANSSTEVNPPQGCTVSVDSQTWGAVKLLYR